MKKYLNAEYTDQEKMRIFIDKVMWQATIKQLTK